MTTNETSYEKFHKHYKMYTKEELAKHFGGIITPNDFYIERTCKHTDRSQIADRVISSLRFDDYCKTK